MFSNLAWRENEQLKAQTSHGVAMAVYKDQLCMVYVGQGGANLWMAQMSSLAEPLSLTSNSQIRISNHNPQTAWRPAIASDGNLLHCVYSGQSDTFVYWSWFDGANWAGNIKLPPLPHGPELHQVQTSLMMFNGILHCVAVLPFTTGGPTNYQMLMSTYTPGSPLASSSWSPFTQISSTRTLAAPSLSIIGSQLILAATNPANGIGIAPLGAQPISTHDWAPLKLGLLASIGAVTAAWGDDGGVLVIFSNLSGSLFYAYVNVSEFVTASSGWPFTAIPIQGDIQIVCPNSTPATSAPPGVAVFHGCFVVAYKGVDSDNFFITYAPAPLSINPGTVFKPNL